MSYRSLTRPVRVQIFLEEDCLLDKLFSTGPIYFGREAGCNVVLKFSFISKKHFEVCEENGIFVIRDLKSRNGIRVQGRRIKEVAVGAEPVDVGIEKLRIRIELPHYEETPRPTSSSEAKTEIWGQSNSSYKSITSSKTSIPSKLPSLRQSQAGEIPPDPTPQAITQIWKEMESTIIRAPRAGEAVLAGNFAAELVGHHPAVMSTTNRRLEAVLLWNGLVYNVHEFAPNDKVLIGATPLADIQVPHLVKGWRLAQVNIQNTECFVPKGMNVSILEAGQQNRSVESGVAFKLNPAQIAKVDLGSNLELYLRHIPAAAKLEERKIIEPDEAVKRALIGSALFHVILVLLIFMAVPKSKKTTQVKNVPERYARLLLDTPKPVQPTPTPVPIIPTPPPVVAKPTPVPVVPKNRVEVVKKKTEVARVVKPKQTPIVTRRTAPVRSQPIRQTNKKAGGYKAPVQMVARGTTAPRTQPQPRPVATPPPVKVESLGALGALSQLPNQNSQSNPSRIQITKQGSASGVAGGSGVNTEAVQVGVPSGRGNLVATGSDYIKTQGKGSGRGSEYGTQGLKSGAGNRQVGATVGTPSLKTSGSGRPEGLTRQQVMDVVQKHLAEIQRCYERNLLANPNLSGRMEFEWDIEPQGRVSSTRVKKSSVQNGENLGECVQQVIAKMKFPKAKNGQSTQPNIGFPFGRL